MWRDGVHIEMPGEYKKRYAVALGTPASKEVDGGSDGEGDQRHRWLSRLTAMLK